MSYKICVYAICKNESQFVDRWMTSMSEADLVVVTDTGSGDDTVEKLRERGALVFTEEIVPWRFDAARNAALNNVPEDVDICVCADLDELFEPGWREKLEAVWDPSYTRGRYLFTSDFNADNTPRKQFAKEKVHRRNDFKWVHPVHEVLEYSGSDPDKTVFIPGMVMNHFPDYTKPRVQYLPLLELSAEENQLDSQTVFWLGREYSYYGKHDLCVETLQKYLKLPTALWNEERSAAMRLIASAYEAKGDIKEAKAWLFRAIAECPHTREPYLKAARHGYNHADWPLVYAMVKSGLIINNNTGSYLVDVDCWGYVFYDLGAISAYRMGMFEQSLGYAIKALSIEPGDQRLQNNLKLIEAKIAEQSGGEVYTDGAN